MNLKTSEFQVEELNRAFVEKQEGAPEEVLACDQVKINVQLKTLEKMNNKLTADLKEEKGDRRMLEGRTSMVDFSFDIHDGDYLCFELI